MKYNLPCILAFFAASTQGFATPSGAVIPSASVSSGGTNYLSVRHGTQVPLETSWQDLHEFNISLDKIAEQCGSVRKPVVSKAAQCEELFVTQTKRNGEIVPDTISFNTVLKAWNRCCSTLSEGQRSRIVIPSDYKCSIDVYTAADAARHATTLLLEQKQLPLDAASYNIVIDTWAKSRGKEAPEAAERVLKLMLDDEIVEPDTFSYNGVLDAWANAGREDGLEKIMQIYKHMQRLREQGKDVQPTIRTVNAILNAHAKIITRYTRVTRQQENQKDKADAIAEEANQLFLETKAKAEETGESSWQPDVMTFTILMDIYSKCGNYDATQKAENLLKELKEKYKKHNSNNSYRPNFRTYTALLTAWSRTRSHEAPKRVEELLEEMKEHPVTQPNARSFTSAIQCWAKSSDNQKAKHALKILLSMKQIYKDSGRQDIRPSIMTYNAAIDACAKCMGTSEEQAEALKIAFAIFKSLEADDSVEVNQMTYSMVLHAVNKLLPTGPESTQVSSAVFQKAKKTGHVDQAVVRNMRLCAMPQELPVIFEGHMNSSGQYNIDTFPKSWTKCVR